MEKENEIDEELFKEFFEAMLERMREKQKVYGDSWKDCSELHLKNELIGKFDDWYSRMRRNITLPPKKKLDETKLLVDIANFAMLIWLRHKKQFEKERKEKEE